MYHYRDRFLACFLVWFFDKKKGDTIKDAGGGGEPDVSQQCISHHRRSSRASSRRGGYHVNPQRFTPLTLSCHLIKISNQTNNPSNPKSALSHKEFFTRSVNSALHFLCQDVILGLLLYFLQCNYRLGQIHDNAFLLQNIYKMR
jgi:hypothetical protein